MKQLTAGILFAGGGGVECGMVDAGIDPVWAVEWNPHNTRLSEALIHSHERNFPDCKIVAKPVQQVNWQRLPKVDILWASPMCSNFSMAKNAEETLEDIEMAMAVCDAIAILTPTYFYLENVAQYKKSVSFDAIVSTLKRLGYSVEYSVENFAHYGLPQARKRLILRSALGVAVPPLPKKVEKQIGWYEAIADLIPGLPDSNLLPNQQQSVDEYLKKNPPVPLLIDRVGGRGDYKVKPGHLPANTILRSRFTDGNNRNRNRFGDIRLLSAEIKSLTIECVRRLQGFPEWYQLPEMVAIAGSILGYSVPPLFVKQLFTPLVSLVINEKLEKAADALLFGNETERFRRYLLEYLYEAFGIQQSSLTPDIALFVNAQARTYSHQGTSEINNICGMIQLSPGRSRGDRVKKTITKVPESAATLDFGKCKLLYDSLAFTDVLTQDRRSPQEALERQLSTLDEMPVAKETWLVSYDLLIDEKFVDSERKKQRWTVEEGWSAVEETVAAAKYLDSQRHRLGDYTLVMSCQGVDAVQYEECVRQVLKFCQSCDVIGLGGWCILGRQPSSYLKVFWETINRIVPVIAQAGIKKIHIFGVTWYKPKPGFDLPPLAPLLWLCDRYGISLSTDGTSPIGNALWKDWRKAGATHPYWRHNLAYVKAALATIRDTESYQAPPGHKTESNDLTTEFSTCGLAISFGWTAQYLPNKSVTRRIWKDSHAAKFIRAYGRGDRVVALNKDKRNGGEQIGWCRLTVAPYKERLSEMPESDVAAEGGMVATVEEFIQKYFEGDRDLEVWVVRFEFVPLTNFESASTNLIVKSSDRYPLDRYDSPHWFATAIAPYVELGGTIGECCVGGGVLARCLKEMGCTVWTNDINPDVDADYHHDVTCDRAWDELPEADWIFTNPPYGDAAFKIVRNAYQHAKRGVVFLLRTTWDEPCEERAEWLFQHPITRKLTLPRYKFRENKHGKLSVEASTIAAFVWDKQIPVLPSLSIPRDRIPLFHDSASNAPSWDEIVALIKERFKSNVDANANEARKKNSTNTIFLTRNGGRGKNAISASGSLISAPSHKLKSGDDGATRYLYQWGEQKGSVWRTKSKHVPIGKLERVKQAIASRQPITEILELL